MRPRAKQHPSRALPELHQSKQPRIYFVRTPLADDQHLLTATSTSGNVQKCSNKLQLKLVFSEIPESNWGQLFLLPRPQKRDGQLPDGPELAQNGPNRPSSAKYPEMNLLFTKTKPKNTALFTASIPMPDNICQVSKKSD